MSAFQQALAVFSDTKNAPAAPACSSVEVYVKAGLCLNDGSLVYNSIKPGNNIIVKESHGKILSQLC